MDDMLQAHLRREYNLVVGERIAEELKVAVGSVLPYEGETKAEVVGRDGGTGTPKSVVVSPQELRQVAEEHVNQVVSTVVGCLSGSPPDLAQDVGYSGIYLTGGGANLRGLDRRISAAISVPVKVVENPQRTVAVGAGQCLESFDSFRRFYTHGD